MSGPRHVWVDGRVAAGRRARTCRSSIAGSSSATASSRRCGSAATDRPSSPSTSPGCAGPPTGWGSRCRSGLDALIAGGIADLLAAEDLDGPTGDASVRITVSRGAFHGRGLLPPDEEVAATIAIQAWPVLPPPADHLERGLHLVASSVRRDPSNPLATLKTTSRADYVFARLEARRAGRRRRAVPDDRRPCCPRGRPRTSSWSAAARTASTELATPSLDCAILPGTTRSWLLDWASRVGLRPVEAHLTVADLAAADEAFLSSSVAGILPVTRFDGAPIGDRCDPDRGPAAPAPTARR